MAYDKTKDPSAGNPYISGRRKGARHPKGLTVTPSDTVDLASYAAGLVVITAGNIKYIPSQNADADTITVTAAPVGFIIPHQVRRVFATGTTGAVATLEG
jgi:hypothetical protein